MKKILISGLILVMMSSALVGCGKNSDVSSNITSKEIAKKLIEADYLISPKEVDSDMVEEVYHLNLDDVENYAIYETERRPGPGFIMIVKAKDGKVENVGRALLSDAIATTIGAWLGVSTVTTFVESSTGVLEGGRTGYTAITAGILFLIAMFFSPIFIAIPSCATAPALIYVGYLMLTSVKEIEFENKRRNKK